MHGRGRVLRGKRAYRAGAAKAGTAEAYTEAYLIAHGHTEASVAALSMATKARLVEAFRAGIIGPQGPIFTAARMYALQWQLWQEVKRANEGRKYRRVKLNLAKIWPEIERFDDDAGTGDPVLARKAKVAAQLAGMRAAAAKMGNT